MTQTAAIEHQFEKGKEIRIPLDGVVVQSERGSREVTFKAIWGNECTPATLEGEVTDVTAYIEAWNGNKTTVVVMAKGEEGSITYFFDPSGKPVEYNGAVSKQD